MSTRARPVSAAPTRSDGANANRSKRKTRGSPFGCRFGGPIRRRLTGRPRAVPSTLMTGLREGRPGGARCGQGFLEVYEELVARTAAVPAVPSAARRSPAVNDGCDP